MAISPTVCRERKSENRARRKPRSHGAASGVVTGWLAEAPGVRSLGRLNATAARDSGLNTRRHRNRCGSVERPCARVKRRYAQRCYGKAVGDRVPYDVAEYGRLGTPV
jgi:hypothetical protein